jgi:bacterioferritin-associated ferredoxin
VEAVSFASKGRRETIPATLVCLHEGVVPNPQMTRLIGCAHRWDKRQHAFRPTLDRWGNTTIEAVQVAGDGGGIAGAQAAESTGRIAVLEAARALGRLTGEERDRRAAVERRKLARLLRGRPFIDTLYGPRLIRRPPADDTIVCRCEEVTAGQVRQAVREGCQGPNQVKSFLRCGMGTCQGRFCGLTVSQIIAAERGAPMDEVGYYRIRPPIKPIELGALAETAEA